MSDTPSESEFDLEKLFLPAWAQESPAANKYAGFSGDDRPPRDYGDRPGGRRPPRRDGGGPGRDRNRDGNRPPRPQGAGGGGGGGRPQRSGGPRERRQYDDAPRREMPAPAPLPQINITILPEEKGVESLARQIRVTGRAYPLFDIARLILQKPERQQVRFDVIKNAEGQIAQPLFLCALDDSLWLSENDAVAHLLGRHFGTFYQAERTATEPPKGTYTFVAQCGMSGTVLGPPNHHDYQNHLRKLHTERFSRMPFEAFKNRVKIVRDEAVVKKWIEDQSFKTEYNVLNVPEPLKLPNRDEVEKHFRAVHLGNIVKQVESHTMSGAAARQLRSPDIQRLLRVAWEDQRRFPLKLATTLSQQFAGHGLQFFKVNRTVTHVSVARPHFLDLEATPVSEGVKRIVDYINKVPKSTRRKLLEALAPTPKAAPASGPAPSTTSGPPAPVEAGASAPTSAPETTSAPAAAPPPAAPTVPDATPEQAALAGDLHWLIHQGHVIEFATGILETAKKPLPKPPPPPKKTAPAPAAGIETAAAPGAVTTPAPAPEAPAVETGPVEEPATEVPVLEDKPPTISADAPAPEASQ